MSEHEQNLRDLAAMFAMMGMIVRGKTLDIREVTEASYAFAHELMLVRDEWFHQDVDEGGIAAIKPKRKVKDKE